MKGRLRCFAALASRVNLCVGAGCVLQTLAAHGFWHGWTAAGFAPLLTGTLLILVGCAAYAKAKGYNPGLGMLGLFHVVGLAILAALPRRGSLSR